MSKSPVPRDLAKLGALYEERNKIYGTDYLHSGEVLKGMFPNGLTLRTAKEFRRFYMFVHMLGKLNRYAQATARSEGHDDSLNDLSVYGQMTKETDHAD